MSEEDRDLRSSSDLTPVLTLTRSRGSQIRHILLPCSPICPPVLPTDKRTS